LSDSPHLSDDRDGTAFRKSKESALPSFSIVIPSFQRRDVVSDAVRAISQLSYPGPLELIVVVDGSTDGTAAALKALECPIPFRILEQPNSGAAHARNRGAAEAAHEILLFLDDDMMADPDLVREHACSYEAGADAVIGDICLEAASPPGFVSDLFNRWLGSCQPSSPLAPFDIFTGQLSVRRSVFNSLGGFDEAFTSGSAFSNEDADFGARLLAKYEVRRNPAAISRLRYVVTARQLMARVPAAVAGQRRLLVKHPELTQEMLRQIGSSKRLVRYVYRPLSFVPLFPQLLSAAAVRVAEAALKSRFRSNKAVAAFFSAAQSVLYWQAWGKSGGLPDSDRLLILCYHLIEEHCDDPVLARFSVRRKVFEAQLESLKRRGFVFVGPDALAALLAGATLPRRAVLLTFDDCYPGLPTVAREALRPRGIQALAFAVTGLESNEWDQALGSKPVDLLSAIQLRELATLGVEVGCHSRTHRDLRSLTDWELVSETAGAADDLVKAKLPRPRFFAYPFGVSDQRSRDAVQKAGYVAGLGLTQRYTRRAGDVFDLPRIMIVARDSGWRFHLRTFFPLIFAHLRRWLPGV